MPNIEVKCICFNESDSYHKPTTQNIDNLWEEYVKAKDASLGYYLPVWFNIFEKSFGHKTYALIAFEENNNSKVNEQKIIGVLPITHVKSKLFGSLLCSIPFVNYGGMLCDTKEAALALTKAAQKLRKDLQADAIELRHMQKCGIDLPAKADHKVSMVLDLPETTELLWKSFKDKVRNQVRKAEKNGLSVKRGGKELVEDFYSVFCVNMRDLGTPVYAKSFFSTILNHLEEETEIICVYHKDICIASGILYRYGDTMQMPWASSLLKYRSYCPNHSLYWEALRISTEEGFKYFDFGRSTPQSGPWSFKKQWGVREVPLCWEYLLEEGASLPALSNSNPKFDLAIKAWKKLPLFIANTVGPKIVRGIP